LNRVDIVLTENVVEDAVKHFYEHVDQWLYPSKSYFVAICYASWIAEDFNEYFYELLDDEMLLAGNDPYFVVYSKDKDTYDAILKDIQLPLDMCGMVPDVRGYYEDEFKNY
jgi:putative AlgH/UPF0301 family transcriptional regulator